MQTKTQTTTSLDELLYLPAFAKYLLEQKLDELLQIQLQISKELSIPILNAFSNFSPEQIFEKSKQRLSELLTYLAQNKASQQIENAVQQWEKNTLPFIQKDDIVAEDITLITYLRKKSFLYFLPDYCSDPKQMIEVIKEIDLFLLEGETAATNLYIKLLKQRIHEHSHFIEKITNTSPGIIYVYDVLNNKELYANKTSAEFLGFQSSDILSMGDKFVETLIHPEDIPTLRQYEEEFKTTKDGEIRSLKYRIKNSNGEYRWLRTYETVFKRNAQGDISEKIGIAIDVHTQKIVSDELQKRETELLEAQKIAQLGNYVWDLTTNEIKWSEELYRIYGLQPQSATLSFDIIQQFVHPDDKEFVSNKIKNAVEKKEPFDFIYRIYSQPGGTEKILHAQGKVQTDVAGNATTIIGTAQDVTEKQNLIEELKKSEVLYKQAESLANLGNWSLDLKTKQYSWSDEMYNIYELPHGTELTVSQWEQYIHPEEKAEVLASLDASLKNQQPYNKTYRIILPSGKVKTLHRKAGFEYDKNGVAIKMIGTTQDVTEQQKIQQELKENQTFIRKITDAAPSIIASYNVKTGKYVFISQGLEKLLSYNTSDGLEKGVSFFLNLVHPDDIAELKEKQLKFQEEANTLPVKKDPVVEHTYRLRHKNGQYRWIHTYSTVFDRDHEGKIEHVLNISLDVTEQKEATQKIAEQEHFIQQIADASPTILYLYDVDKQSIVYINREIFFVLGHLPDEIIETGEAVTAMLYHPDDFNLLPARKQSQKNFQQVDSMMQYECRLKNKDGDWRWFLVREIVFKTDEKGRIKQILGAALDINRRKEMEKTILQNALLLEQSNASLEEFAYVASHDLKEPLRKISTFGDRLIATQMDNLTPEGKIYLNKIVDASQRMQTMINDLLSISMISGNHSFEKFSLQKILDETLQTLEFKIEQQNAIIKANPLPVASIIPAQFRQLFQNLLSNSLKFVKENTQPVVTIKYSLVSANEAIHYQLAQANHYHKIEIADNGIGFENEFAGKIFAIFQRLHGRSEFEGSGIGLAICKKIVEHHGGIIYADGIPGAGATFTIILPA